MADNGPTANGKPAARRAPGPQHAKKTKGKKPEEPIDHAKLVAQAISQIESKQAGDREQDLEIGTLKTGDYCCQVSVFVSNTRSHNQGLAEQ